MALRPRPAPVPAATRAIRLSWEQTATKAGLLPVAAYWRWLVIERQHECHWLKKDWHEEKRNG